mmetsp:Transcript_58866/g.138405  ORF Transcript_58866/g.138405 Transcript_58866/m.138405 type:complete len:317 (+) Transcript_58866:61-1011(+)
MFDLTFPIPTDSMMLSDWHRADDPWGAYLAGPGDPAHNLSNPQAETVYVPYGQGGPNVHGCESGSAGCYATSHTTALGAGPEFYNNMEAPHNCVGGSEGTCIPDNPPVFDPSKTGMATSSHTMLSDWHKSDDPWGSYLDGPGKGTPCNNTIYVPWGEGGPDVHACEAGSPGCYANSTHTSALGAGPEFYNNMGAPHNCSGGSEGTCIPNPPPVLDWTKTGMAASSPSMLTGAQPSMALAVPVAAPTPAPSSPTSSSEQKPLRASPAHLLLPAHAFLLAAIQGLAKGDLSELSKDAVANTKAVTPVGGHYLSQLTSA